MWVGVVSGAVFVGTLLLTPYLLGIVPADYFLAQSSVVKTRGLVALMKRWIKNLLGLILLLAGVIMLITPGQGIVSIFLGLFLMEFPQKRALERKLINHDGTFKTLNWLRQKAGKPPFLR